MAEIARILEARASWRWGPDRLGPLTGHPVATVAAILHREGVPRRADLDRSTGLPVRRYEACHPSALVHQDHERLGRIPDGDDLFRACLEKQSEQGRGASDNRQGQ